MVVFVCLPQFCTAACLHVAWKWRNLWLGVHNKELFKFLKTIFLYSCTFEIEVLIKSIPAIGTLIFRLLKRKWRDLCCFINPRLLILNDLVAPANPGLLPLKDVL